MTGYLLAALLAAALFAACGGDDAPPSTATSPAPSQTATAGVAAGTLSPVNGIEPRLYHTATVLPGGSVLLAGGSTGDGLAAGLEVLDAASLAVIATADLIHPRQSHSATLLSSGLVLIAGGVAEGGIAALAGEAELFDPAGATLHATASLQVPRLGHHAIALDGERALIAGGVGANTPAVREVEVYDLSLASFKVLATLPESFGAVVGLVDLGDGTVLVAGVTDAAVLDLSTGQLTVTADAWPAASRVGGLPSGAMLVVGACCDQAEVGVWVVDRAFQVTPVGNLAVPRAAPTLTEMADGRVLLAGGSTGTSDDDFTAVAAIDIVDPVALTVVPGPEMNAPRAGHTASLLGDGSVLLAGVFAAGAPSPAERFSPA